MPADQLAGDTAIPRVAGPDFGASERVVVSPGHEADGIIHMPGGPEQASVSPFWARVTGTGCTAGPIAVPAGFRPRTPCAEPATR